MRAFVIVLLDPACDRRSRLFDAAILVHPDFFLFQAAMKTFDVAVAFRMMIRRSAVRDAQPRKRFHIARRSELCSVVGGQRQLRLAASSRQSVPTRIVRPRRWLLRCGSAAKDSIRRSPACSSRSRHQVRPARRRTSPHFGHVRLPDLIRLGGFHAAPLFSAPCSQPPRQHQQSAFAHHPQYALVVDAEFFFPLQPQRHTAITERRLLAARRDDLFVVAAIGARTTDSRR